jgi:hypothetical protein
MEYLEQKMLTELGIGEKTGQVLSLSCILEGTQTLDIRIGYLLPTMQNYSN